MIPISGPSLDAGIPASKLIEVIQGRGDAVLVGSGYVWMRLNVESLEFMATVASGSTTLNAWWLAE